MKNILIYILRPDNTKGPTIEVMKGSLRHVSVRMKPEELAWWTEFIEQETERRRQWEDMTDDKYQEAGTTFDLLSMQYKNPVKGNDEQQNEAYKKREKELKELIEKKNNFPPISMIHICELT